MNRLSPLTLPRFDVKALSRTARALEAHTQAPDGQSEFEPEPVPAALPDVPAEEAQPAPHLQAPVIPEPEPVDTGTLLASLEASLAEIERAAVATCHQALAEFFASAFPRLNEAFLAAEIAKALESVAPPQIEKLIVQVPSTLEASFSNALQVSAKLSEVCELQPMEQPDKIFVEANWGDGGLQFDMDQFLKSSLGRLSGGHNS